MSYRQDSAKAKESTCSRRLPMPPLCRWRAQSWLYLDVLGAKENKSQHPPHNPWSCQKTLCCFRSRLVCIINSFAPLVWCLTAWKRCDEQVKNLCPLLKIFSTDYKRKRKKKKEFNHVNSLHVSFFFFGCTAKLTGILVPQLGIEPGLLAQSPNHWIARKLPRCVFMVVLKISRQKWLCFFFFFKS